jgi:hypothetical protein
MPKITKPSKPVKAVAKSRKSLAHLDLGDESSQGGGAFFAIQNPLIHLIDEYLLTHPVDGKRMTLKVFSEKSGISVGNLTAIVNGNRWAAKISRDAIERLATTLEIPVLQVFVLSGFLSSDDLVCRTDIEETVNAILRRMSRDKTTAQRLPGEEEWMNWPLSAKISMSMMYEALTTKTLLRYTIK